MPRRLAATLALVLLTAAPAAIANVKSTKAADLPQGAYVLDKTHASLSARVSHMGFSHYTLRFTGLDASFTYDPKAPRDARLNVAVDPSTLDTGTDDFARKFNKTLTGDGWFDVEKYPSITFVSTGVDLGDGQHGQVSGDLTLHGVTRPVTLDVTFNGVGPGLIPGGTRAGFSATTTIRRSDFGMTKFASWVADDVDLVIEAEFIPKH